MLVDQGVGTREAEATKICDPRHERRKVKFFVWSLSRSKPLILVLGKLHVTCQKLRKTEEEPSSVLSTVFLWHT